MTEHFSEAIEFITQALDELVEAQGLWDSDEAPPGPCYLKLNEAGQTLQRGVSRIIQLSGEANQLSCKKAVERGEHLCAICFEWRAESLMQHHEVESSSKKAREAGRTTSWWTCTACEGEY